MKAPDRREAGPHTPVTPIGEKSVTGEYFLSAAGPRPRGAPPGRLSRQGQPARYASSAAVRLTTADMPRDFAAGQTAAARVSSPYSTTRAGLPAATNAAAE